ncbi:MAG: glycosyltransferase family 4 protein [Bacteroidota bacterium]|nr:glycosyltransferase family 4 protein [Bacteroidota bacterium]
MNNNIVHLNFAKGFRGGERQTLLLIQELALKGYKQEIYTRKNSELAQRLDGTNNLKITQISKPYFINLYKVNEATLIHAHETKGAHFAYFANILYSIPYIVTRRVEIPLKNNFFNKNLYRNALYTVVLSRAIEKEVLKLSSKIKTQIIPSAYSGLQVDTNSADLIRERFSGKFLIGHIGELKNSDKGQYYLLEAMKRISKDYPQIDLILLGRGEDEQNFKEQMEGFNNVTFEGFVNNVADYIATFDLFVFPSLHEGLGSILFDVMQAKVPIAASNVGGIPDIIEHNKNGLLYKAKSTNEIYDAIVKLYKDKDLREGLSNNAYKNIENYSASSMTDRYEKLYRNQGRTN